MAGILDALRAFFNPAPGFEPSDERGLTFAQMFGTGADEAAWTSTTAGERVDSETAIRNIAVQSAIRLLVNDIGSLPVDAFRKKENGQQELSRPTWVIEPNPSNPNATWEDHVKQTVYGMLTDGNAFTYCFPSVFDVRGIRALAPESVDIKGEPGFGDTVYRVQGVGDLTPAEVVHVPWMLPPGKNRGLNPIEAAKQGIGIALAADQFVASYFGNNAFASGWLEVPAGTDLTNEQIKDILNDLNRKHKGARKAHAIGAITGGASLKQNAYNNRDAQLLELRDSIVEDVARLFGIPPHMLGSQKPGAVGYASVEQRSIDYVTHAVLPIVRRIEIGYSRLLRGQKTYLRFNVEGLKRGDANARAALYTAMLQNKVIRREEVRALEELPFDPTGVGYLETPNNNPPDNSAPTEPEPQRTVPDIHFHHADGNVTVEPAQVTVPVTVEPAAVTAPITVEQGDVRVDVQPAAVTAPITVEPATINVQVPEQRTVQRTVKRNKAGLIESITETPTDGE